MIARVYEAQFGLDWVMSGKKMLVSEARARKAIEQYQIYLKAVATDDPYREQAKSRIERLQQSIELFRRKGMLRA